MFSNFTPGAATLGGVLIGLSASLMLLGEGRVAGISGILGGLLTPKQGDVSWRGAFLAGLVLAGAVAAWLVPDRLAVGLDRAPWMIAVAGLLVGVGTRLGNGCTSGHGVCGLSRASPRSLASVVTFMGTGALVATLISRLGGAS